MFVALIAICFVIQSPAFAQGCAMCKASVANSAAGQAQIKAFNNGVVALLIPPVGMMCAILGLAYKRRGAGQTEDEEQAGPEKTDWSID